MDRSWLSALASRALSPAAGFRALAEEEPGLGPSVGRLLLLRGPFALAELALMYATVVGTYRNLVEMKGPLWGLILQALPPEFSLEDLRAVLQGAPALPSVARLLPWFLLAAPLYVLSLWLHDAAWDHGCLWMLGGLKGKRGFRASLLADSEALSVGVFGAAAGLLTSLPYVGWFLALPVGALGAYFWVLRGFSLAAFHRCPLWKGIVATLLHAVLVACCLGAFGLVFLVLLKGIV